MQDGPGEGIEERVLVRGLLLVLIFFHDLIERERESLRLLGQRTADMLLQI